MSTGRTSVCSRLAVAPLRTLPDDEDRRAVAEVVGDPAFNAASTTRPASWLSKPRGPESVSGRRPFTASSGPPGQHAAAHLWASTSTEEPTRSETLLLDVAAAAVKAPASGAHRQITTITGREVSRAAPLTTPRSTDHVPRPPRRTQLWSRRRAGALVAEQPDHVLRDEPADRA